MTSDEHERVRQLQRRLRDSHQKLFNLQGATIDALRDAINAVAQTQDEMLALFQAVNAFDDIPDAPTSGGA
jgi:flagellar basal body P-ring protein FlgI